MDYVNAIGAWISAHAGAYPWLGVPVIVLTILGSLIETCEAVVASTANLTDDDVLAKVEASWYGKVITSIARPFSVVSKLKSSPAAAAIVSEKKN